MPLHPRRLPLWLLVLGSLSLACHASAQVANGFDLSGALIPVHEILGGGPPRDGIPALTDPPRVSAAAASRWLEEDDRVMGIARGKAAVAYPIRILNWHEIVNDRVGGEAIAISYCPLCGTGVVFDAEANGRRLLFGVSGLLYNSDILLYDRGTMSLFSQMLFKAVTGPLRGQELRLLPSVTTTWAAWRSRHPDTEVLSQALPYGRDYSTDPYHWYRRSGNTMFPVKHADGSRRSKDWGYLIVAGGETLVIAEETLQDLAGKREPGRFRIGKRIKLAYDPAARELRGRREGSGGLIIIPGYWFALTAFHPEAVELTSGDLVPAAEPGVPDPYPTDGDPSAEEQGS
ncbi:MAG: DUF3179 domain-containing protein [Acidobacteriota bacterium]